MGVFEKTKTNWKYIFVLIIVTIIAAGVVLVYAAKVGKEIAEINQRFEIINQ